MQISAAAAARDSIAAFVEVHIEQGPVLLNEDLPLGVVTAIAGGTRYMLELEGLAGHAGTVPMHMRHDAAMAAAEFALYVEQRCSSKPDLVGTIGQWTVPNGATNVIPGRAILSLDVRAGDDAERLAATVDITAELERICARRKVRSTLTKTYETSSAICADWLQAGWQAALQRNGCALRSLPSGAGHDAMAIAAVAPIAMLFVRCGNGGISHLVPEMFKTATGLFMVHIPYRGSAPAFTDLMGGQVQFMAESIPQAANYHKQGKVRALAAVSYTHLTLPTIYSV